MTIENNPVRRTVVVIVRPAVVHVATALFESPRIALMLPEPYLAVGSTEYVCRT